jgi:hypothetical protein
MPTWVFAVRFDGWQATIRGDQEVRQALRKTLFLQFKIRDNDVYEKAIGHYGSITDATGLLDKSQPHLSWC